MDSPNIGLGNNRYLKVCSWKGETRVDLREWENNKPTKKGISLTLLWWKELVDSIDDINEALHKNEDYQVHFGGNVYCTVRKNNPCVDVRQYWKPQDDVVPCKKGLCLRPSEFEMLRQSFPDVAAAIPELSTLVPCRFQSNHMNQLGYLSCSECNPNDCGNWSILMQEDILKYVRELGRNWELFAVHLGYEKQQLDHLKKQYPRQIETLLYVLINEWHKVVSQCDRPKPLLAYAFQSVGDNSTASKILDNGGRARKPGQITLDKVRGIHFES